MADFDLTTEYEDTDAVTEVEAEADETKGNTVGNMLIGGALILTGYTIAKGTDLVKNRLIPWATDKFKKGKDKAAAETEVAEVEAEEVNEEEPKEEAPKKTKKK